MREEFFSFLFSSAPFLFPSFLPSVSLSLFPTPGLSPPLFCCFFPSSSLAPSFLLGPSLPL